jgi:hypothetical protein
MVFLSTISEEAVAWVERAFEEWEVFEVVNDLNGDIRLQLQMAFLLLSSSLVLEVIKVDVMEVFLEFHECGKFQKSLKCDFHFSYSEESVGF